MAKGLRSVRLRILAYQGVWQSNLLGSLSGVTEASFVKPPAHGGHSVAVRSPPSASMVGPGAASGPAIPLRGKPVGV